ncbi:MAG: hypothetical protein AAFN50_02645 [Pseudomonadota bacterium]
MARAAWLLGSAALLGPAAAAENVKEPDMAFLEYLGMWEETDEEWQLFDEVADDKTVADNEERSDPVPKREESQELEDEN